GDQAEGEEKDLREGAFVLSLLEVQPFLNIGFNIRKGNRLPLHLHSIGEGMCLRKDDPQHNVREQPNTSCEGEYDKQDAHYGDVDPEVRGYASRYATQHFSFGVAKHLLVVGTFLDVVGSRHGDP